MVSDVVDFPQRPSGRESEAPLLRSFRHADLDTRQVVLTAGCVALAIAVARMFEGELAISLAPEEDVRFRRGVGICLLSRTGRVFVERRPDLALAAWRLPQGQMRPGEAPLEAAQRVLREDCGWDDIDPITQSFGWLRYEVPEPEANRLWQGRWRGQQQKWIAARFRGRDEDLDRGAAASGLPAWRWAPVDELAALIRPLKRASLEGLVRLFG
jgi:putative (di)nucleoside polyphosphate hydrolase